MKKEDIILLDHGSGGRASHELLRQVFLPQFKNSLLEGLDDSTVFEIGDHKLAFSTDSYTVDPIFFPGGDIGCLAVNGTVNDLAMQGADPLYLSAGFIIEEGFPMADLKRILGSMKATAKTAGVQIITGDTKVVNRGGVDKIFINTSGIGLIRGHAHISGRNAQPGDAVLVSGSIGDHGIAILSQRAGLSFESVIQTDSAPLNGLVAEMMLVSDGIHAMRDPTRGGLATTLNEIAIQSNVGIELLEDQIPVSEGVQGACELLGLDPLYVANEGKLIAFVASEDADKVLSCMQAHPYGRGAGIIGRVVSENRGRVFMKTRIGGTRILDMLVGEQLPRIC
ncbi:MAG: hydrogenase expression/formation protein HypE [Deltaproteobacteria bacterium]|nr:hydrogenase expression/formation protein HypE [Deltaproteobacteria bacterium]MBW2018494.1 hydrogenase expression/formation protein HypE [Deltaproteobacteria bacterium]MBW2073229.1 hydrogenase expression/formation protein HypE [Deltaproteobacteria bacterium]RLB83284.1 MAG: hydrogenase expression/formation protein HypE [Deltaproteobacteria bacterium]